MLSTCYLYLKNNPHVLRFGIAGVANTLVHLGVFLLAEQGGASVPLANTIAFITANIFSFFVASYFVFTVRVHDFFHYLKFLTASFVGVAASWSIGHLCAQLSLPSYWAVVGVVLILPPISYVMQRLVFWGRKKKEQPSGKVATAVISSVMDNNQ